MRRFFLVSVRLSAAFIAPLSPDNASPLWHPSCWLRRLRRLPALSAQPSNRITQPVDVSQASGRCPITIPSGPAPPTASAWFRQTCPSISSPWFSPARPSSKQAFEQFLADQQNPASPDYHHWLTPAEVGERFGLSDQDIATITGWLQSQGLHVNWVAPSRIFIGFGGTAANVGHAFQTEMQYYSVRGEQRLSVNSDPMIPAAISPPSRPFAASIPSTSNPTHHVSAVAVGVAATHRLQRKPLHHARRFQHHLRRPLQPYRRRHHHRHCQLVAHQLRRLRQLQEQDRSLPSPIPLKSFPPPTAASTLAPRSLLRPREQRSTLGAQ